MGERHNTGKGEQVKMDRRAGRTIRCLKLMKCEEREGEKEKTSA